MTPELKNEMIDSAVPLHVMSIVPPDSNLNPPLVFVHMSWGGGWAWKNYFEYFARRGYACYAMDLRAHGQSEGEIGGVTMQDYMKDVQEVVKHFSLDKPVVVGHSMGGLVALMYAAHFPVRGVVSMDGSPTQEVQGEGVRKTYPESYRPFDAGMPSDPMDITGAFPDISQEMLMNMGKMLGVESGTARSQRKVGISVEKNKLNGRSLFIGAEKGTSVPFGIGTEKSRKQAEYYGGAFSEIKGATHPGLLIGSHWSEAAEAIESWLKLL